MKKILIVSYLFAPENTIGAIRWTKIAKYLDKNKYQVEVMCCGRVINENKSSLKDIKSITKIHKIREKGGFSNLRNYINEFYTRENYKSSNYTDNKKLNLDTRKSIYKIILRLFDYLFFNELHEKIILFRAKKYIRRHKKHFYDFDVIISTYSIKLNHSIAMWLKKEVWGLSGSLILEIQCQAMNTLK